MRELSRDFVAIDHSKNDSINNFISIVGGKATTLRAMGEVAADLLCKTWELTNNVLLVN